WPMVKSAMADVPAHLFATKLDLICCCVGAIARHHQVRTSGAHAENAPTSRHHLASRKLGSGMIHLHVSASPSLCQTKNFVTQRWRSRVVLRRQNDAKGLPIRRCQNARFQP